MFATTTIKVLRPTETLDSFGDIDRSNYVAEAVDEVLVSPSRTEDNLKGNPEGVLVDYVFHFPYWYTTSLKDCRIEYEGEQYIVIGDPRGYMPENTPTSWNRPVLTFLANNTVEVA